MSKGLRSNKTLQSLLLGPEKYAHLANEKPIEQLLMTIIEAGVSHSHHFPLVSFFSN